MLLSHLRPGTKTARFYTAKPSEYVSGREVIIPAGNVLGGGSSINFMLYTRAQGQSKIYHLMSRDMLTRLGIDFDLWETDGWSRKDMLPLLNKVSSERLSFSL
jgi:alcohol oxidase